MNLFLDLTIAKIKKLVNTLIKRIKDDPFLPPDKESEVSTSHTLILYCSNFGREHLMFFSEYVMSTFKTP